MLSETDLGHYGMRQRVSFSNGGHMAFNRNTQTTNIGPKELDKDNAFIIEFVPAEEGNNWFVASDDEMREIVRAYLRVRGDIQEVIDGL